MKGIKSVEKKTYLFLSYLYRAQLSDLYLYAHIRNGWYEGRYVIRP